MVKVRGQVRGACFLQAGSVGVTGAGGQSQPGGIGISKEYLKPMILRSGKSEM